MKYIHCLIVSVLILLNCVTSYSAQNISLQDARHNFQTNLVKKNAIDKDITPPPSDLFKVVRYKSSVGYLSAYLSLPVTNNKKYPAIIWLVGGFSNSISSTAWRPASPVNDQSARAFRKKGIIMMYPSLRGGNNNPGYREGLYGEVNDVIAAYDFLAAQDSVDSRRIYLGGHSTGGTLALLVAESTDTFRAVFSLGPVGDIRGYGNSYFYFDISDPKEWRLRSPLYYLESITTPTYIFEGANGNIKALRKMRNSTQNENIHFFEIPDADHFSIIAPLTDTIAEKILQNPDIIIF